MLNRPSKLKNLMNDYGKVLSLLAMMVLGALFPQFHSLSFLIQYLLMVMLFLAFLDIDFNPRSFRTGMIWVLLANVTVAFAGYWVFASFDTTLALAAFMTGIAPTAIASPVIIGFIEGQVEYAVGAVLLTNIVIALVLPFALPLLLGSSLQISAWQILQPVLVVMFVPLILAWLTLRLPSRAQAFLRRGKRHSFLIWLVNLFIISANASNFIRNENAGSLIILLQIAAVSLLICILNFALGAFIGGGRYWQEASQALGQKNNSFAIWIALTFINPLVAMGPTFYIIYHNLYNSLQIYLFETRRTRT